MSHLPPEPPDLTPEERFDLLRNLNALIPSRFSQLLFVLGIPKGILPSHNASQAERVTQLLAWAESTGGCGLITIQTRLRSVVEQDTVTQTRSVSTYKPFLEISNDGSMRVWDINIDDWCELPANTNLITSDVTSKISNTVQNSNYADRYAKSWKRVHSLTEELYPQYVKLHRYMLLCQELSTFQKTSSAERRYRFEAASFFEKLKLRSESFQDELNALEMINQVELISLLCRVPICSPAINQSLASSADESIFCNGVLLTEKISDLLLEGLHVADQLLEVYFGAIAS